MVTRGCTAQRCSSASETTTGSKQRIGEHGTGLGGVAVNLDVAETAFRAQP
jgi:hypothetical protein